MYLLDTFQIYFSKIVSPETRLKNSLNRKGKKLSEEHKKNIGIGGKGKIVNDVGRKNMSNARIGKKPSIETRRKQSEAKMGNKNHNYGKPKSLSTKNKIGKANSGKNSHWYGVKGKDNHRSIPVTQYDLNDIFVKHWNSATEAAIFLNISSQKICMCCMGKKYKKTGGFKWRYTPTTEI